MDVVERSQPAASSRQLFVPSCSVPVSLGSSPITTSIAAPKRNPVITGFDSSRDSHPIRRTAASRKSNPVASGDRRDELRRRLRRWRRP